MSMGNFIPVFPVCLTVWQHPTPPHDRDHRPTTQSTPASAWPTSRSFQPTSSPPTRATATSDRVRVSSRRRSRHSDLDCAGRQLQPVVCVRRRRYSQNTVSKRTFLYPVELRPAMGLFDRLRGDGDPRVAFIGVDGVPYSLLSEHEELFPNFAALADDGTAAEISSIVPPESSACWPSLTTGKNPGETGVYGFQDREVGTYDTYVPMGRDVQADRVWDIATEEGRDATVMNVPVTFPPQRNVQRMVSGFLSPGIEKAAYPDDLAEYLEGIDYKIDANAKLGHSEDKSEFIENAHETLDARYEAFSNYIEQDDWDLFFGVFMTTDRINHF